MFFDLDSYKITTQNEHKLVISIDKNVLIFETLFLLVVELIVVFMIEQDADFEDSILSNLLLGLSIAAAIYFIGKNVKLIMEGEKFTFNKTDNTIYVNNQLIGKLDNLSKIYIIEHQDDDSIRSYRLSIQIQDEPPIKFTKSLNLESQQELGKAISTISGVSYIFMSDSALYALEKKKEQRLIYTANVKSFEKKFAQKELPELQKIAKEGSPFANYAKEAAKNLLKKHEDKT